MLLSALCFKLHLPPLTTLKFFSIAALAGSCITLYFISRFWLPRLLAIAPALLMLLYRGEIIWTVSGLETAFYQLLVLLIVYCLLWGLSYKRSHAFLFAGLLGALSALTRPEAPALLLVFLALLLYMHQKYALITLKHIAIYLFSFLIFYTPYFAWHWFYFSRLFPNSVYCKGLLHAEMGHTDAVYLYFVIPLWLFILPCLYKLRDIRVALLIAPTALYLVLLFQADFVTAFFNRLFLPCFALTLPLLVLSMHRLYDFRNKPLSNNTQTLLCLFTLCLIGFFLIHSYSLNQYQRLATFSGIKAETTRRSLALWIKTHVKKNETVALGDCGLIPYVAKKKIIDTYCLNSKTMTEKPIDLSYPRYIDWLLKKEKPNYIILLAMTQHQKQYYPPADTLLLRHKAFRQHYQKRHTFKVTKGYFYTLYQKKNTGLPNIL